MHRIVHHHAYVRRTHAAVCAVLEGDTSTIFAAATRAAAEFADEIADNITGLSEFFDVDEEVAVQASELRRYQGSASLSLSWLADPTKRLLPNVVATMEINPILEQGPSATTELTLHGEYDPPDVEHRGATEFFLERRVVNAALHVFLDNLAKAIETQGP